MVLSHALLLSFGSVSPAQVDRSERLNSVAPVVHGSVDAFQVSPNLRWMAYRLGDELHVRTLGGSTRRISSPGQVLDAFRITPDSGRVVYSAGSSPSGPIELWSSDGSGPPVRLSGPMVSGGSMRARTFALSPDGLRVYYTADQVVDEVFRVYGVPSDGSAPAQGLTSSHPVLYSFQVSPDGTQLVFHVQVAGKNQLFVVPSDGSGSPARLNPPGVVTYSPYEFSPDGGRLAFRASLNGRTELYTVPLDLSTSAVVLNDPMAFAGEVVSFDFTPDSQRIAFAADVDSDTRDELYLAPADGSAAPIRLDGGVGAVIVPRVSPDGARVVFATGLPSGLFSVALAGGAPVQIGAQHLGGDANHTITPDSRRVVYLDRMVNNKRELYSTPIDGSAPPVKLSDPPVSSGTYADFRLGPNGRRVVFIGDPNVKGQYELFVRPVDGSLPAAVLNPPLGTGGSVGFDFALVGPNTVFRADARVRFQSEVYSAPLAGGPASVVDGLLPRVAPQVSGFSLSRDEERIVYVEAAKLAPGGTPGGNVALRSVELSNPGNTVRLNGEIGAPFAPTFGPRPDRVYFTGAAVEGGLYSAPLDAAAPPTLLAAGVFSPTADGILFSSTGRHVLVGGGDPGAFTYLASVDGSQPLQALGYAGEFTPDGRRVVFQNGDYNPENGSFESFLFTHPADLSVPRVALTPPNVLREFQLAGSDSSSFFVVYRTPTNRLFRVHAPDGSLRGQISPAGHGVATFQTAPDGSRAVYAALGSGLYLVDVFPTSAPVQLAGPVLVEGDNYLPGAGARITFTPDGRVLYLATAQASGRVELFSVPLDASAPPARISGPFVAGGSVRGEKGSFVLDPRGARVVYLADQERDERFELYSAPTDGSAPAVKLSGALADDRDVELPVLATSLGVVFRSDLDLDERLELWFAALDGRGAPRRVNGPLLPASDVQTDFLIDRRGEVVYYRADQEVDERVELFRHPLSPRPRTAQR